jgi:uncharacterized RDD family membrane protein YckC
MPATHRADQEFVELGDLGELPLATFGGRFVARVADFLIVFVPTYFPFRLFIEGFGTYVLTLLVTLAAYDAILTAKTGTSPGKRLARIKVVRDGTGALPGWGTAVSRAVVLTVTVWIISAVVALFDETRHRGVHDLVARTVVVAA